MIDVITKSAIRQSADKTGLFSKSASLIFRISDKYVNDDGDDYKLKRQVHWLLCYPVMR